MKQLMLLAAFCISLTISSQNDRIDSLTVQLAYQKPDSAKVDTSLLLINELYKNKDYKKAFLYINRSIELSNQLNYTQGLAEANYKKALIYEQLKDYLNAIDNYSKSKIYYDKLDDSLGAAKASQQIGIIEIRRGNYNDGLKNALSAITIFEELNMHKELSSAYDALADAYTKTNQVDIALDYNYKALEVREILNDSLGIKASTIKIADLYAKRKEHRKSIEFYEKALNLISNNEDPKLKSDILPKLGCEYLNFKEYDKAAKFLVEGLIYSRKNNNKEGVLKSLNALATLNLQRKKLRLVERQLNEAYGLAKDLDDKKALLNNYRLKKELDSTRGFFQNAYFWQGKYYDLKSKLEQNEAPKLLENLEAIERLEVADINPENQSEQESSKKVKSNERTYIVLLAILAGILLITSIVLLSKRRTHQKEISTIKHDLKQEKIRNESILEQTHHLEEVNQVKDKLFSIVSHDLKDSISSIKAFLDLLKEDSITREEFDNLIPELSENANNASALLFNLLNWSKSQMQSLDPKPELFDIQEVFHNKMALVEQKVEDKRIVLIDESQPGIVYADKSMIEIVLQNLITNAVKFSRTGDVITVCNKEKNGKVLISVEDTGVGISKENIDKLFDGQSNFTTTGTKNEKGTGLGLTIAKDLVELNHGKIWVESEINNGSKFFIELPKSK